MEANDYDTLDEIFDDEDNNLPGILGLLLELLNKLLLRDDNND